MWARAPETPGVAGDCGAMGLKSCDCVVMLRGCVLVETG